MKKTVLLSMATTAVIMAGGDIKPVEPMIEASATNDFGIFTDVKFNGELRTRYESVDITDTDDAITTRFALSVGAGLGGIEGLSVFGQIMAVTNFGYDDYESAGTIADPANERVTQAYLDYKLGDTGFRLGRQMINLDDQRFVGAVDWRQMPQTFMGYTVTNHSIENLNLMASYLTDRYGVTDALSSGTESILLHADYQAMPALKLTGYGYLLATPSLGSNSNTYGVMASGKAGMFNYIAEVATQQDSTLEYQNYGKSNVDAMYYRGDVSTKYNNFIIGAAYESFGDGIGQDHGFTTPLATLHKWQGFADVFLKYSAGDMHWGLNDTYLKVGYVTPKYGKLVAFYHDFSTKETDPLNTALTDDAGSEFDLVYTYNFSKDLNFMAKTAFFSGDSNSVIAAAQKDKDVFWAMVDYKF